MRDIVRADVRDCRNPENNLRALYTWGQEETVPEGRRGREVQRYPRPASLLGVTEKTILNFGVRPNL